MCISTWIWQIESNFGPIKSKREIEIMRFWQSTSCTGIDNWNCNGLVLAINRLFCHHQLCGASVSKVRNNDGSTNFGHCVGHRTDIRWNYFDFVEWYFGQEDHAHHITLWISYWVIQLGHFFISRPPRTGSNKLLEFTCCRIVICHIHSKRRYCTTFECVCRWKFTAKGLYIYFIKNFMIVFWNELFFFRLQIRTSGMVIYTLWYNVVSFLGDKYFPIFLEMIHLHGCFLFFAVNCCVGILFVIFVMKETKGQSLDATDSTESTSYK